VDVKSWDIRTAHTTKLFFKRTLLRVGRMKNEEQQAFVDVVIEFNKNDTMLDKVLKIYDEQNTDACYVSESFIKST
jgi:hypothetical protein